MPDGTATHDAEQARTANGRGASRGRDPVLVARGISKVYGSGDVATVALRTCDVALYPGLLVAVMGPSGSGKSTLLHLLAGLDEPTEGVVEVEGRDVARMNDAEAARFRAERVGFVLQRDNLIPALTLRENVAAPLLLAGTPRAEALERAGAMLDRVGIAHRGDCFLAQVSGGEAQRAAVARACAGEPLLVFADEPTGALDRASGEGVIELMRELVADVDAAAMIVSHDPDVARAADVVVNLLDGRVVDVDATGAEG